MKITSFLACCVALALALAPRAAHAADAEEVSFDFFYTALADDGDWYNTPEYGYVWQPYVGYKTDKWRPYSDGYWAQTEDGWTWVAYENFGWATYHYGRWTRLADLGWVWVPGYEWGPGWVSWRTNEDYVGWAPLPPKKTRAVYEGKAVVETEAPRPSVSIAYNDVEEDYSVGYTPSVDEDYDIGPDNYCFVETRHFGAPVLSAVFLPPARNYECVQNTVNVTRITYYDEGPRRVIYNSGPDFAFVSRRSERPIQQLRIERRNDLPFVRERIRAGGNANRVQNGVFEVASPLIARRDVNFQQTRPQRVKQDLQPSRVVRGWDGAKAAAPDAVTRIRQQMKQQASEPVRPLKVIPMDRTRPQGPNPGSIPPAPVVDRNAAPANVPPGARPALTDAERAARRDQRLRERDQRTGGARPAGQPVTVPNQPPPPTGDPERDARRNARQAAREQGQPVPKPAQAQPTPTGDADRDARRAARQQAREQGQKPPQPQPAQAQPTPTGDPERDARRAVRQQAREQGQPVPKPAQPQGSNNAPAEQERAARQAARQQAREQQQQQAAQQAQQANQERAARQAARQQAREPGQQPPQPQQNQQAEQERAARQAARQQERQQQQGQQAEQERAARQAARQQERQQQQGQQAEQERAARQAARQQQQQGQQAEQERAARQAARQQERQQQQGQQAEQERAARQAARQQERQQQAAQQQKPGEDDKKKKKDGQ